MPPKRGRLQTGRQNDETQRLPVDERRATNTANATGVLDRRPHHLISRLHPPWSTPSTTAGNTASNHLPPHLAGTAAIADKSTLAGAPKGTGPARGRAALTTRVAGRSAAASRDQRKETLPSDTAGTAARGKRSATAVAAGYKRSRSQSASNPIEVHAEDSTSSDDDSSNESSQASSVSLSPSPMVAESKKLASTTRISNEEEKKPDRVSQENHSTLHHDGATPAGAAQKATAAVSSGSIIKADAPSISPQKLPPPNIATSTADSKVLFGDEDEEEDGNRWPSQGRGGGVGEDEVTLEIVKGPGGVSPLAERLLQETHVLGELSDGASVTPARPTRVLPSQVQRAKAVLLQDGSQEAEENEEGKGDEVLGEHSGSANTRAASRNTRRKLIQQIIGEETENQTASTGPATPSLLPTSGGISPVQSERSPGADAVAASLGVAAPFAETLAVQDLSYLPEEGATAPTQLDASSTAHSPSELHTPRGGLPAASTTSTYLRNDNGIEGEGRRDTDEVLLGDGLVSPPVKRATATPQQAAQRTEGTLGTLCDAGAVDTSTVQQNAKPSCLPRGAARELRAPPPLFTGCSASSTTESSLLTPHTPENAVNTKDAGDNVLATFPSPTDNSEAVLPPHGGSLPSTLDDGCWKDDEQMPQQTPPTSLTEAQLCDNAVVSRSSLAKGAALALQETVPIDPFLSTPPHFRQDIATRHTEVLSEDSDATPKRPPAAGISAAAAARTAARKKKGGSPQRESTRGGQASSKAAIPSRSPTPPRDAKHAAAAAVTDVDSALLKVGTRVEARWGRQWFPATVSEVPRNGFVQIEWEEDASLLHVRLREVRLPILSIAHAEEEPPVAAKTTKPAAATGEKGAATKENGGIITATQLVALMDEEDAEDSRHEVDQSHNTAIPLAATLVLTGQQARAVPAPERAKGGKPDDLADSEQAYPGRAPKSGSLRPRKRSTSSSAHRSLATSSSSAVSSPPQTPPPPALAVSNNVPSFAVSESGLSGRAQMVDALPFETTPSALCIFLSPSVRKELLQGTCNPPNGVAASTDVQRNTELQRILHSLTSAGATVISSLAQADNVAAQLGDSGGASASCGEPVSTNLAATTAAVGERHALVKERSPSLPSAAVSSSGAGVGGSSRRKTVGRVPLPRRSATGFAAAAATTPGHSSPTSAKKKFFVFLVAGPTASSSSDSLPTTDAVEATPVLHHVPDVCVAHAFGVSAIHASWLWSLVPGAPHVRLPTAGDEVRFPSQFAYPPGDLKERSPALLDRVAEVALRLTPFPSHQRWLSGQAVQFLERDDAMEMWLNAAGAVVTAEPPPQPAMTASESVGEVSQTDKLGALAAAVESGGRRHSASLARLQPPPRKQPCVERRPNYVYIRETGSSASVDLTRLGDVPVLQVPWLVWGIEQHYRARHSATFGSSGEASKATHGIDVKMISPPLLFSVLKEMQKSAATVARSRSRSVRSPTPTVKGMAPQPPATLKQAEAELPHRGEVVNLEAVEPAQASVSAVNTSAVDGNTKPFLGNSPDAKQPTTHSHIEKATVTPSENTSGLKADVENAQASPLDDFSTKEENNEKAIFDGNEEKQSTTSAWRGGGDAEARQLDGLIGEGPAKAAQSENTAPHLPLRTSPCAHPVIAVGEDYYFSIAVPSATALHNGLTQLQHTPSAQIAMAATTVALGRVVALFPNQQREYLSGGAAHYAHAAVHSPPCCYVGMQLYEAKYVSMHVDPRSGEVVHQTTVYLSPQRTTVPAAALLFEIPVYVITAAARQHVYILEDGEESGSIETRGLIDTAEQQQQQGLRSDIHLQPRMNAPVVRPSVDEAGVEGYDTTPSRMAATRQDQSTGVSASPVPTSPHSHARGEEHVREENRHTFAEGMHTAVQRWAMNVADKQRQSLSRPHNTIQRELADRAEAANDKQSAAYNSAKNANAAKNGATKDTASSCLRTLDVAELDDCSPNSVVSGHHAVQVLHDPPVQRRVSLGNAPRAARLLTQLLVKIGKRTVVLRPACQVSFFPRRSVSLSERASTTPLRRNSQAIEAESPSDLPLATGARKQETPTRGSEAPSYHNDNDSDSSEELIAEAPLVGRVELMREMDGNVDIVVHTAQPNSVFGGSKMYRITPDMITDASDI